MEKEKVTVEILVSYRTSEKTKEGPKITTSGLCNVLMDVPKKGGGPVSIRFQGSEQDRLFLDSFVSPAIEAIRNGEDNK